MKNICFIIGQHRSGTSALSGLLQIFGAKLGSGYLHEKDEWNKKGYFENIDIVKINEKILSHYNTWWSDTKYIDFHYDNNNEKHLFFKKTIKNFLIKESKNLGDYDTLVIKDPRISLLIDFYQNTIEEIKDINFSFIFSQRNINENIKSIVKRGALTTIQNSSNHNNTMNKVWAKEIIIKYNKTFEDLFSKKYNMLYHTYSNLEYDLKKYFIQVNKILNLNLKINNKTILEANKFFEKKLNNNSLRKSCKVIATYFGSRRRRPSGFSETKKMWKHIIKLEKKINPGDSMDTIISVHNHGEINVTKFIYTLDAFPTRFGIIKIVERPWENGIGASFKSFDNAYRNFKNEYYYWIFNEDNVFIVENNYLTIAKRQQKKDKNIAFVGIMRCDAREPIIKNGKVFGGKLFSSEERRKFPSIWHCHGGCGLTNKFFLEKLIKKYGSLPYSTMEKNSGPTGYLSENDPWYRDAEQNGEVKFTSVYHLFGYKVVEVSHDRPMTYYFNNKSYA